MDKKQIQYPQKTIEEIEEATGIKKKSIKWIDEQKERMNCPYLYKRPSIQSVRKVVNYSFAVITSVLVISFLFWIFKSKVSKIHTMEYDGMKENLRK